jgi:hypothetical protein
VRYVPDAVALHDYEFTRNPRKLYFAERNRWITVLTVYPAALLIAAVPAMVLAELGMLALAARQGWLRAKLSGYAWLISHASWLRRRRANIRRTRSQSAAMLAGILSTRLEPAVVDLPPWIGLVNRALDLYWRLVRLVVPRTCRANQPSQARPDC